MIGSLKRLLMICCILMVAACTGVPTGVTVVQDFELSRYLGVWYEIARLDHPFERELAAVTATYSMREDGGVRVLNRGYHTSKQAWEEAVGRAYFNGPASEGRLKVSFFGPFYGGYNIIALDPDYQHALVCGPDRTFLWVLSRAPDMQDDALQRLVAKARRLEFPVDQLIYVRHDLP